MAGRHGSERYRRREQALAQARAVGVPDSCDVCVPGGGASGLVAAIAAAEEGARVVVLERDLT
jgi:NADPH-dependent 2,4-dienoyl-CoA reductase/sulfur reductase-like enzyme